MPDHVNTESPKQHYAALLAARQPSPQRRDTTRKRLRLSAPEQGFLDLAVRNDPDCELNCGNSADVGDVVGIDHISPHRGCINCPYSHRHGLVVAIDQDGLITVRMLSQGNLPSPHIIVPPSAVSTLCHELATPIPAYYSAALAKEVGAPARTLIPTTPQRFKGYKYNVAAWSSALVNFNGTWMPAAVALCTSTGQAAFLAYWRAGRSYSGPHTQDEVRIDPEHGTWLLCLRCNVPCDDATSFRLHSPLYHSRKAVCAACLQSAPSGFDKCVVCLVQCKPADTPKEALLNHASCTGCGTSFCFECMAAHLPFAHIPLGMALFRTSQYVPELTCGHCDRPHAVIPQALRDARACLSLCGCVSDPDDSESNFDPDPDPDSDPVLTSLTDYNPEDDTLSFQTATGDHMCMSRAEFGHISRTRGFLVA